MCFILTFSLSALIAVSITFLFFVLYKENRKLFVKSVLLTFFLIAFLSFALPFIPTSPTYTLELRERLELANLAKDLTAKNFLLGTGLNTFPVFNRLLQPVHNIFLLVLTESGLIGLIIFLGVVYKALQKKWALFLIPILVIGFFDHYFLTLQQNLLSFALVFGAIFASKKSLKLEHAK